MAVLRLDSKIHCQRTESNSQHDNPKYVKKGGWIPKYTVKELKAIHNQPEILDTLPSAGFQNTLSKNWKQFTTVTKYSIMNCSLDSKIHCQRTESNSQHKGLWYAVDSCWIPKYTVKELKAIHNSGNICLNRGNAGFQNTLSKNWKQFTTITIAANCRTRLDSKIHCQRTESNSQLRSASADSLLCWIPKYTVKELKAIHN